MSEKKKKSDYTPRPAAEYWDPNLCPVCGNNEFVWGTMTPNHYNQFKPKENVFSAKHVEARQCKRCGNIQLFAEK